MSIYFKSIASSSDGNCLALWTENTCVLIDSGLGSMKRTRHALKQNLPEGIDIDALIISHIHTDHISYYPLRVFEHLPTTVMVHRDTIEQLKRKHFNGYGFADLDLQTFSTEPFTVGDFTFNPFQLAHHPDVPTYGFTVTCKLRDSVKKIVIATDFKDWTSVFDNFLDADFIFVESNHDLELLRRYYNHNSNYHLSNPETSELLYNICQKSARPPKSVMLGHISSQRNDTKIAIKEVRRFFKKNGTTPKFKIHAAPLRTPSETIEIKT